MKTIHKENIHCFILDDGEYSVLKAHLIFTKKIWQIADKAIEESQVKCLLLLMQRGEQ